jgi:hypothetical protein
MVASSVMPGPMPSQFSCPAMRLPADLQLHLRVVLSPCFQGWLRLSLGLKLDAGAVLGPCLALGSDAASRFCGSEE